MHNSIEIANKFIELSENPVSEGMTPMKVLKLVYIAHGWTLGVTGERLVSEDIEAWRYGPVIPALYQSAKSHRDNPINAPLEVKNGSLPLSDKENSIIRQVSEHYGNFNGLDLSAMTHKVGTPWHTTWHKYNNSEVIPVKLITSYYQGLLANVRRYQ